MILDNAISSGFDLVDSVIKRVWPDENERAQLEQTGELARLRAAMSIVAGQLEINKKEAEHPSIFVAGWRPFLGWVCGFGLAYNIIVVPFLSIWLTMPEIDDSLLWQTLTGMLGLGAFRTYEKTKGVSRTSWKRQ